MYIYIYSKVFDLLERLDKASTISSTMTNELILKIKKIKSLKFVLNNLILGKSIYVYGYIYIYE
jgi:hypothetical protein